MRLIAECALQPNNYGSFFTAGWYVVTKGNSLSAVLCFCGFRADCPESKVTSDMELFEEFVLSSLILHSQFGPHFGKLDFGRLLGLLAGGFPCILLTCFVNSG